ncbi:hypothetical protein AVEN_155771-1 [Araneus ventricosus]|uniref:Uncharacterized protein n=1 Tax=Araneus ventricosus TaxID=182803 RepID=A0A4Y2HVP0_ARAVE|nr:hypothetical protein AVEN_155771-1 [Araneus ventricosus]
MTEDQKVSHLMKGVAEDLYQVLINREVCTVHQFVTCCRQVDAMSKRRVFKPRSERLPNVTLISTANKEDLSDLIRRIVREEIQKVLPQIATCTDVGPDGLESIIREEVRSTLAPLTRNDLHLLLTQLKERLPKVSGDPDKDSNKTADEIYEMSEGRLIFSVLPIMYQYASIVDDRVTLRDIAVIDDGFLTKQG